MNKLNDLVKNLTRLDSTDAVRRKDNSYARNTEGGIIALSLSKSKIESLVLDKQAAALEHLYLSDNEALKQVEIQISLPHLKHLYLDGCGLEALTIPKGCDKLEQIYVQKNQLKKLVFEGDCEALQLLDVSGNDLTTFVMPVVFERLDYLYLKGNDNIGYMPKEIYAEKTNSAESVKAYLRASFQSGNILNREAKCIFFGNGRTGKTTLSHQLRMNEFDKDIQYTHGILIEEWTIPHNDLPDELKDKIRNETDILNQSSAKVIDPPQSIQLNVWDFGGQEYFHATHRLFLNSNVLYLLVWEQDTNKQDEEKGDYPESYWQSNIKHYAPKNITLNIQNKEKGNATINHSAFRYKVASRNEVDRETIEEYELDVKTLRKGIFKQLSNLDYLCTPIPKLYDDIRQELRKIKAHKPYLLFEEYKSICQSIDITKDKIMQNDTDIKSLTMFLHDTGCLICYRFDDKKKNNALDNYVFINPQWVTETIYQILDEKTLEGNGEFDKIHVANVLGKNKNVILDASIWIDLMTEFELIFKKRDTDNHFIATQYLPKICQDLSPKALENLNKQLPHKLVLKYPNFLPKSVMSRFICINGNLAQDYYWKYGIVIHKDDEEAFVFCDYANKEITIQTHTSLSDLAVKLFDILRGIDDTESLEVAVSNIKDSEHKIKFVNFKKLKERAEKGKTDVEWNGQDFDIDHFKALLGGEHGFERKIGRPTDEGKLDKKYKAQLLEIPMVKGARELKPFNERQEQIKILFLAATPTKTKSLNTGKESRFKDLFRYFDTEKQFLVKEEHGVTTEQFQDFIIFENPHIVHYGGHGEVEGIVLEDESLEAEILVGILQLSEKAQCVILNACNSLAIAEALASHIPYVIGTQDTIDDRTAIAFAKGFYMGIVAGKTIEQAFQNGLLTVKREKLPDADVLVLVKGIQLNTEGVK